MTNLINVTLHAKNSALQRDINTTAKYDSQVYETFSMFWDLLANHCLTLIPFIHNIVTQN